MMIVNDNSSIVNKLGASLTDDARVIIYDSHMFIVQATGVACLFSLLSLGPGFSPSLVTNGLCPIG